LICAFFSLFLYFLDSALARVEEVLEGDELFVGLEGVHLGLVVLEEQVGVGGEHLLELLLEDGALEGEVADDVVQLGVVHVEELVLGGAVHDGEVLVDEEVLVELDVVELNFVHVADEAGVEGDDGVHEVAGLLLVEEGDEAGTADHGDGLDGLSTDGVGGELTVLVEELLQVTGDLLHGDVLGGRTDTGDGETDVDGGALTTSEELGVEVDLTVGNGNDVGDDVGGDIVGEGLDDGEGGDGTATLGGGEHGRALEEAGVEVEDITGVGFTAGGTAEKEGELTVGDGLLGKIVVDDEAVTTAVHEVLTAGDTGVGGQELETGGLGGGGGHDGGVLEGAVGVEEAVDTGDVGATLTDGDVDGDDGVLSQDLLVHADLVDDGGDGDGGLAGLTITDDELTLTAADGDHGVDGLETGEEVDGDGGAGDDVGGASIDAAELLEEGAGLGEETDGDFVTEGVDDLAEDAATDGDGEELAGGHDLLAGLDLVDVVHQDDTDAAVLLQVEDEAGGRGGGRDLNLDDGVVRDTGVGGSGDDGGDGTVDGVDVADELGGLEEVLLASGGILSGGSGSGGGGGLGGFTSHADPRGGGTNGKETAHF
jgi:hypothetical protein